MRIGCHSLFVVTPEECRPELLEENLRTVGRGASALVTRSSSRWRVLSEPRVWRAFIHSGRRSGLLISIGASMNRGFNFFFELPVTHCPPLCPLGDHI
jgi:hypothetical protein